LKKVTGTDKITEELIKNQPETAFAQIKLDWSCSKSEEQKRASYKQLVELLLNLEKKIKEQERKEEKKMIENISIYLLLAILNFQNGGSILLLVIRDFKE
jgi:hypothetical protein